jgi:hypothetical protein
MLHDSCAEIHNTRYDILEPGNTTLQCRYLVRAAAVFARQSNRCRWTRCPGVFAGQVPKALRLGAAASVQLLPLAIDLGRYNSSVILFWQGWFSQTG